MRILTTTMCYPTPSRPDQGVFVQRRAAALARRHEVHVVAPQPWCPLLRRAEAKAKAGPGAGLMLTPAPPESAAGFSPGGFWSPAMPRPSAADDPSASCLPTTYPRMLSIPVLGWATDGAAFGACLQKEVRRLYRAGHPAFDLIDAHFEYPDGVGAYLAARKLGLPVVVTLRGKLASLARRPGRRTQIAAMLRGADGLIAVCASLARLACQVAGRDLDVAVIPNGVDTAVFHPLDRAAARAALGWDACGRYVLSVGHYQRLKGFDRLISIWPAVRRAAGDVRLVLVGSRRGERGFLPWLRRLARANGTADAVAFRDTVGPETLNLMYNAADLCVNASRSEGWCNAIAESLAAGTPVVATGVGGNAEQIRSGQTGLLVPDGDSDALAAGIVAALARAWDRAAIAAGGSARSWGQAATEATQVFERIVGHAGKRTERAQPLTDRMPVPQG